MIQIHGAGNYILSLTAVQGFDTACSQLLLSSLGSTVQGVHNLPKKVHGLAAPSGNQEVVFRLDLAL